MRKRLGALLAVGVVVLALGAAFAAPVGAGVIPAPGEFSCSYSVSPTTLPPEGGFVTVEGTAPGSSTVRIFVDGVEAAVTTSAPVTGEFSASVFIGATSEVTVALDDYPSTPCIGVGGESVDRDGGTEITVGGTSTGRLPFTGASSTGTLVRAAVAALCVGLVLVVASRRRIGVRGRS